MSRVMVSLPDEFLRGVDKLSRAEHRTRSELIREAIRAYVAGHAVDRGSGSSAALQRAASRILSARIRLPAGETSESVVRTMRDRRYGSRWKR